MDCSCAKNGREKAASRDIRNQPKGSKLPENFERDEAEPGESIILEKDQEGGGNDNNAVIMISE
jgi:hypothetical protein